MKSTFTKEQKVKIQQISKYILKNSFFRLALEVCVSIIDWKLSKSMSYLTLWSDTLKQMFRDRRFCI